LAPMSSDAFSLLSKPLQRKIEALKWGSTTDAQESAIPRILAGENVLIIAPTGTGKTEAAIFPVFDLLLRKRSQELTRGISILYVTPLRALNRDIFRRLIDIGKDLEIAVEIRHGDTPQNTRRLQAIRPPDMLITTPETLQAILSGKRMREHLRNIRWVIIDEVHELAESKRGVQLTLGLERLQEIVPREVQRIGLSATVGSPEEVARFLAGTERRAHIIDVSSQKEYKYFVERPIAGEAEYETAQTLFTSPEAAARILRIQELVDTHDSTLIFVNSRQNAEMLGLRFTLLKAGIGIHHGSLAREERHRIEDDFKSGKLKGIVCTSTLELGIDIGSVDLVIQYLSPRQVSSFIQRVGRSGHGIGRVSQGIAITAYPEDSLEALAVTNRALRKDLEPTKIPETALDVLAHQVAGLAMDFRELPMKRAYEVVKRAYPYNSLSWEEFSSVTSFMDSLRKIRVEGEMLCLSSRTRDYYLENLSMIPDERLYPVVDITTDKRVCVLGEEFMSTDARVGLNFISKGYVWQILQIDKDGLVYVKPVDDPTAAIPGWDGEMLPVPYETAREVGRLRRAIVEELEKGNPDIPGTWTSTLPIERHAIRRVVEETKEMLDAQQPIPTDARIVLEGYDKFVVVHSCFGEGVNRFLGYLVENAYRGSGLLQNWWADGYRLLIVFNLEVTEELLNELSRRLFAQSPARAEEAFQEYLEQRFPFGYYMKFVAQRFGVLPRGAFLNDAELEDLWQRFKGTPVYQEAVHEAVTKKIDLNGMRKVLEGVGDGTIFMDSVIVSEPSPIAYRMLNRFAAVPEMLAPESVKVESMERLRRSVEATSVELFCLTCGSLESKRRIRELPEKPVCTTCGSGLLAAFDWPNPFAEESYRKRMRKKPLTENEQKALSETRRNADIVLSYGKRGIIAMSIRGIGPQTASRVLAKMHMDEDEMYKDLLEAKIHYLETRQFWDDHLRKS